MIAEKQTKPVKRSADESSANWFVRRESLVAFLLGAVAMIYVQGGSYEPSGRDSFYHIKMAVLLPEIGFPEHFHWVRHSILNDQFVSHHHGFHISLVPFVYGSKWLAGIMPQSLAEWASQGGSSTWVQGYKGWILGWLESPYILGAKVLSVILFGLVVLLLDLILRQLNVGFRWFWLLAVLALPTDFFLRMSYIRAPIASLTILLLVIYLCMRGRYFWVGLLGAIYCHVYGGFVFYAMVMAVVILSYLATGRHWRKSIPLAAAAVLGLIVGLITHPYFPENIEFLKVQIFQTGLQTSELQKVGVGVEWKPIETEYWLQTSAFVLVVFGLTVLLRVNWARLFDPHTLILMILNLIFLGLCLYARRFIEYWPVFGLLSAAAFWRDFDEEFGRVIKEFEKKVDWPELNLTSWRTRIYVFICALAVIVGCFSMHYSRRAATSRFDHHSMKSAMAFLSSTTPQGSLVFADDWDVFPMFFYYNHHNDYVCGLDPQFTNSKDPVLWERYCVITQGRSPKTSKVWVKSDRKDAVGDEFVQETFRVQMSDISDHFGADYVIVDKDHRAFYNKLKARDELFEYKYPLTVSGKPPKRQPALAVFAVLQEPSTP